MDRRGSSTLTGEIISYEPIRRSSIKISRKEDVIEEQFEQNEGTVYTNNGPRFGKRHIEVISFFVMVLLNHCMRQHLSLTIVAMTDRSVNPNKDIPIFDWKNKNIILSSFFWGYIGPQIITGWLMTRYGHKWFVIGSTAACGLIGFLVPWLAVHFGSISLIICRVLQGVCQSFMIPSLACFMSRWVPVSERGRAGAFMLAGGSFATVICMTLSGIIAGSSYGWPMNFYSFGILVILWCIYYSYIGCNSPGQHKTISKEEKHFIIKTAVDPTVKRLKVPWSKILKSLPMWAALYSCICIVLIIWILLTQIPTYMHKIMKFNIKSNGLLTSLIYLTQWGVSISMSILSDYLTNKNYISITLARKIFTAIGLGVPCISLFLLGRCTEEDSTKGVILLIIGVGGCGAIWVGVALNNIDLAPNHAGILQGFMNGFSHIFALLAPLIVQLMVHNEDDPQQWKNVFYMSSAVALSGTIVFSVFGTAKEQSWNNIEEKDLEGSTNKQ